MQIIYISNRPKQLIETVGHVEKYMPFISEGIIVHPSSQKKELEKLRSRITFTLVSEEDIVQNYIKFHDLDHQSKNFLLRTSCVSHPDVNTEFIMSDDDARPIKPLDETFFKEDGRYQAYFYYDLACWRYGFNDFDIGQQNTCQALKYHGMPHLSYASHMPQIINRDYFLEMADFFSLISRKHALCEWSCYFNYSITKFPESFHHPLPFQTLCWPDFPPSWPYYVEPDTYTFENFSSALYRSDAPFDGISTGLVDAHQDQHNLDKAIRWRQYELKCQNPGSLKDLSSTPYSWWKKAILAMLIPAKKIFRHMRWNEHIRCCNNPVYKVVMRQKVDTNDHDYEKK